MLHRFRTRWLAGGGALLLVLSMSGLVAAASLVSDTTTHTQDATQPAGDSTPAIVFTDLNGNGIDDTCETRRRPTASRPRPRLLLQISTVTARSPSPRPPEAVGSVARTATTAGTSARSRTRRPTPATRPTRTAARSRRTSPMTTRQTAQRKTQAIRLPGPRRPRPRRRPRPASQHRPTHQQIRPIRRRRSARSSLRSLRPMAPRPSSIRPRMPMAWRSRQLPSPTRSEARTAITAGPSVRQPTVRSRTRKPNAPPTSPSTPERATAGRTDRSQRKRPRGIQPPGR